MQKIITAINNPNLNEKLKKEDNFKIIGKDLLYKEAILETLEKNNNIDIIILSENLMGGIKLEELIEKIKNINEKVKIIILLEKENNNIEKILKKNKIIYIYFNKKIDLKEIIKKINQKENIKEEENTNIKKNIKEKQIQVTKNEEVKKEKYKKKETRKKKNMLTKIVSFSGSPNSGKTTLALIISNYLAHKNSKVLLIDGNTETTDLSFILKYHKQYKKKEKRKCKKNFNNKYKKLKRLKKDIYYYKIKNELNIFTERINNNLYFFNQLNCILKSNKKIINAFFEIIKQKYNFIIIELSKENINRIFIEKNSINFILLESDILKIKEIKKLLEAYINKININMKNIINILNKQNIYSMDKNLIQKNLPIKNKILEIKENKLYSIFTNQLFKNDNLLDNKKIENNIKIIIKEIIY